MPTTLGLRRWTTGQPMSWLRVFRSPDAAHLGHGGGQEWQMRALSSETCVARRGSTSDDMRMITAFFPRALQRETDPIRMRFLPILHEVKPMSKTRNQFIAS